MLNRFEQCVVTDDEDVLSLLCFHSVWQNQKFGALVYERCNAVQYLRSQDIGEHEYLSVVVVRCKLEQFRSVDEQIVLL